MRILLFAKITPVFSDVSAKNRCDFSKPLYCSQAFFLRRVSFWRGGRHAKMKHASKDSLA
jgi:hypothetical protein